VINLIKKIKILILALILLLNFSKIDISYAQDKKNIGFLLSSEYYSYKSHLVGILNGLNKNNLIQFKTNRNLDDIDNSKELIKYIENMYVSKDLRISSDLFFYLDNKSDVYKLNQNIKNKNIDILIVAGTLAGKHSLKYKDTKRLVFSSSNAYTSNIVQGIEYSNVNNLWAHIDLDRFTRQIQIFHDIFKFENLGIVYEDTINGRSYADLYNIQDKCQKLNINLIEKTTFEPKPDSSKDYERYIKDLKKNYEYLSDNVDAFFLSANEIKEEDLADLLEIFYNKGIPVFSQVGGNEIYNTLFATSTDYEQIGSYGASIIADVLNNVNPKDINQEFQDIPKIIINLDIANKINYKPDIKLLLIADKIIHKK
jgi:ABC-type uncharacterized transport system substrate-binding protein